MDYWEHQTDKPLYPDVVWSKPETKNGAGKLGIFGGSSGAMSLVASSYSAAENAGIGTIHLLVPNPRWLKCCNLPARLTVFS